MTALELIKLRLARRETLYLIIHDDEAKRLLAAWLVYGHPFSDFTVKESETTASLMRRVWAQEPDYERLGELANVPATRARKIFARLAHAGLLWPGGGIAEQVGKLLRSESIAYVENLLPKGARASYEIPRAVPAGPGVPQPGDAGLPARRAAQPGANPPRRRAARQGHD